MPSTLALALILCQEPPAVRIPLTLCTPVASDLSQVGDQVLYQVTEDTALEGITIPKGTAAVGRVRRQSKKVAFSFGRTILKGDSPFASPHAVISVTAEWLMLPDGRTVTLAIEPAPREDDLYQRLKITGEFWPQRTMVPPRPITALSEEDRHEWDRLLKVATDRRLSVGRLAGSRDGNELLHNSLSSMRDVLAIRQTVEFADRHGPDRLRAAAEALRNHSPASLRADKATLTTLGLTFAAAVELSNLYGRAHRGIRGWERKKQIAIHPGVQMEARVLEIESR